MSLYNERAAPMPRCEPSDDLPAGKTLPFKPVLNASRELVKKTNGKIRYAKVLEFDDRETSSHFTTAVVEVVQHYIAKEAFAP